MRTPSYRSYDVVLEPDRWQLRVGQDVLEPEPKVFEFLCFMMRHRGRVVSKAELLDALWSGDVVGESVLTRCVSCARKLLLDDSRTPRFIRTLHGRGYEFIAPVIEQSAPPPDRGQEGPTASDGDATDEPPAAEGAFVGRALELARLKDALRDPGGKRSRLLLVSGEAGIGKTRLLGELSRQPPPGLELHWGRCTTALGAPPFHVWQQCFRSIVRARSPRTVLRAFGDAPGTARKLFLGADRWQEEEQLGWSSPTQRFHAFDAAARTLSELAAQRPLTLLVDDIHAADVGSLLLLEFLAQQLSGPALIVAALRDPEPIPDAARATVLANLRAACAEELVLGGLNDDEVRQFVGLRLASESGPLAESLCARTGGNPFFLSVLVPGDSRPGAVLPGAVRQAVSRRLSLLEPECEALLRLAAVFGREFPTLLLARAANGAVDECERRLASARAARVIEASGSGHRFVHDLVREVLYADMDAEARARAHLSVGEALESTPAYQGASHAALLAHHFLQAVPCAGATRALDASIRAGAHALRNLAYEAAVEHFTRASELLPLCGDVDQATECALLLDLGLAQVSAGQREAGQNTLQLAASKARALGAAEELASVALNLAPGLFAVENGTYDPSLVALLREALELVAGDDALRARLLARLALALYWADTFDERVALCDEAEALAVHLRSEAVSAYVATARAFALLRPDNLAERERLCTRAIELCGRAGDYQGLLLSRLLRASLCLERADLPGWSFEVDAFRTLAEEGKQPQALWIVQAQSACRLLLDGRLDEVEALAGACLAAGQRVRDHNALLTFGVHLTFVRLAQGRAGEVLDVIRQYAAAYPRIVGWRVLHAYALAAARDLAGCAAEYRSLASTDFALPDDLNWMVTMGWLAELCHGHRDAAAAARLYERFAPFAERLVVVGYGIACTGSVQRYLALLATTFGDRALAERHFQGAVELERRSGARLPLAHTLHDYGAFLLEDPDARRRASEPLQEALALSRERRLTALEQRLRQLGVG